MKVTRQIQKQRLNPKYPGFYPLLLLIFLALPGILSAQKLEEIIKLPAAPAKAYIMPLLDAFSANLNTNWLNRPPAAKMWGLDLSAGFAVMNTFIPEKYNSFSIDDNYFPFKESQGRRFANRMIKDFSLLTPQEQDAIIRHIAQTGLQVHLEGPTIFSRKKSDRFILRVNLQEIDVNGKIYPITEVWQDTLEIENIFSDLEAFPTIVPQFHLGTVYGTRASFRFFPINGEGVLEGSSYYGFGIQHNPLTWQPEASAYDIALGYHTQILKIGKNQNNGHLFKTTTHAFSMNASRTFGKKFWIGFTPYTGVIFEYSKMEVDYLYQLKGDVADLLDLPPLEVKFDLEGTNDVRFLVGAGINLLGFNLFMDYNISKMNTINLNFAYNIYF